MKKVFSVIKNEFVTTVMRRSFLLAAIGIPLISTAVFVVVAYVNHGEPNLATETLTEVFSTSAPKSPVPEGYIDQSGLVRAIPASVPEGALLAYQDQEAARQALQASDISAYYLIPADYLENGEIIYVRPDFNPLSAFDHADWMEWVLKVNLLEGDEQLASKVNRPLDLEVISLGSTPVRAKDDIGFFAVPYVATLLFYIVILSSSSYLLSSVTKEKENRVLEILMVSITPQQLFVGKIVALGLVGLINVMVWMGSGYILLHWSGRAFNLPMQFLLPASFFVWGLSFFLLGFALYASLMAGIGALVPNLREASHATFVIVVPLLVPLMLVGIFIRDPNGALTTALSLFPFTAPVVMMTRLAATTVPVWQPVLAVLLLLAVDFLLVRSVAGLFRAQTLLAGQPFSLKHYVMALLGKP